mmetsp:Transcript_17950/g.47096  ORF Transcript_17950/g.47096 Transcript_17950/m.47096 type:complete len:217 (+) Transcript_17950:633-1283(+)
MVVRTAPPSSRRRSRRRSTTPCGRASFAEGARPRAWWVTPRRRQEMWCQIFQRGLIPTSSGCCRTAPPAMATCTARPTRSSRTRRQVTRALSWRAAMATREACTIAARHPTAAALSLAVVTHACGRTRRASRSTRSRTHRCRRSESGRGPSMVAREDPTTAPSTTTAAPRARRPRPNLTASRCRPIPRETRMTRRSARRLAIRPTAPLATTAWSRR